MPPSIAVGPAPAREVHERLCSALRVLQEAERSAVLLFAEIRSRKLYKDLGHSSIEQYAQIALGFSRGRTQQFIRLADRFEELPALRRSVEDGSVSWTKARVVASVATPATESHWIEAARTKGRREIERQADEARRHGRSARERAARRREVDQPSLLPEVSENASPEPVEVAVDVVLHMRPEQYARFEALLEAVGKQGDRGDRVELLLGVLEEMAGSKSQHAANSKDTRGSDTVSRGSIGSRSPYQVHVMVCPHCGKGEIPSTRGPLALSLADLATIACDCDLESGGKNKAAIPPALRRQVLARDRYACCTVACGRTRFLTVHHKVPRENGGKNVMENLVTLCASCHRLLHELKERMLESASMRLPIVLARAFGAGPANSP